MIINAENPHWTYLRKLEKKNKLGPGFSLGFYDVAKVVIIQKII
jgi:hypothetical protein